MLPEALSLQTGSHQVLHHKRQPNLEPCRANRSAQRTTSVPTTTQPTPGTTPLALLFAGGMQPQRQPSPQRIRTSYAYVRSTSIHLKVPVPFSCPAAHNIAQASSADPPSIAAQRARSTPSRSLPCVSLVRQDHQVQRGRVTWDPRSAAALPDIKSLTS